MKIINFFKQRLWLLSGIFSLVIGLYFLTLDRNWYLPATLIFSFLTFFIPASLIGYFYQDLSHSKRKYIILSSLIGFFAGFILIYGPWFVWLPIIPFTILIKLFNKFFNIMDYSPLNIEIYMIVLSYALLFAFITYMFLRRKK